MIYRSNFSFYILESIWWSRGPPDLWSSHGLDSDQCLSLCCIFYRHLPIRYPGCVRVVLFTKFCSTHDWPSSLSEWRPEFYQVGLFEDKISSTLSLLQAVLLNSSIEQHSFLLQSSSPQSIQFCQTLSVLSECDLMK